VVYCKLMASLDVLCSVTYWLGAAGSCVKFALLRAGCFIIRLTSQIVTLYGCYLLSTELQNADNPMSKTIARNWENGSVFWPVLDNVEEPRSYDVVGY